MLCMILFLNRTLGKIISLCSPCHVSRKMETARRERDGVIKGKKIRYIQKYLYKISIVYFQSFALPRCVRYVHTQTSDYFTQYNSHLCFKRSNLRASFKNNAL